MAAKLKQEIKTFILTDLLSGKGGDLEDDDNLLLTGQLDSLGVIRLVGHFEKRLGKKIPPESITVENFRTVSDIARFLESL